MKKFIPLTKKTLLWTAALLSAGFLILIVGFVYFAVSSQTSKKMVPPQTSKKDEYILETTLLKLEIKKIRFDHLYPKSVSMDHQRWGSIAKVGKNVLIQKHYQFLYLDVAQSTLTRLDIEPPENGLLRQIHIRTGKKQREIGGGKKMSEEDKFIGKAGYTNILVMKRQQQQIMLIAYAYGNKKNKCMTMRIARIDMPLNQHLLEWKIKAEDWKVIFETQPCIPFTHFFVGDQSGGQMIVSRRPNHIFLTVGDFGKARRKPDFGIVQNANSDYGRILEININNGLKTNISIGHRNPQGITFDGQGRLWSTEHGAQGGDEVNLIVKGKNYGWPFVTHGTKYGAHIGLPSKQQGRHENYQKPVYAFVPSIGISRLMLIENFAPEWDGDLLVASLKAQTLYRLRIAQSRVVLAEPIRLGTPIRDIYNHGDGTFVALSRRKFIYIIRRQLEKTAKTSAPKNMSRAALAEWKQCLVCHSTSKHSNQNAPSLYGVVGRKIGKSDFANYSPSLKASNDRWTKKRLRVFLRNADDLFEDSSMPNPNIDDPKIITAIIKRLKTLKD